MITRLVIFLLVVANLSACSYLREPRPNAPPLATPNVAFPVVQVSSDQVARAMEADQFFAEYGQVTLLIQGTVLAVKRQDNGDLFITLDTSVQTKVMCNLGHYFGIVRAGTTVTIQSANPQRDASRQPSAVMFNNCTIP